MDDNYENITGKIKILFQNGYGFIIADTPLSASNKDIYFHLANLVDRSIDWADLKVGQKVLMQQVSFSSKGYQAIGVEILPSNSRARSARN